MVGNKTRTSQPGRLSPNVLTMVIHHQATASFQARACLAVEYAQVIGPDPFASEYSEASYRDFASYREANPNLEGLLTDLALSLRRKGWLKCSVKLMWEFVRWDPKFRTPGGLKYKLPNEYTADYARLLMAQEPELVGFFELRTRKTKEEIQ